MAYCVAVGVRWCAGASPCDPTRMGGHVILSATHTIARKLLSIERTCLYRPYILYKETRKVQYCRQTAGLRNMNVKTNAKVMYDSGVGAQMADFGRSRRQSITMNAELKDDGRIYLTSEPQTYPRTKVEDWANTVVDFALENNGLKMVRDAAGSSLNVLLNLQRTPSSGALANEMTHALVTYAAGQVNYTLGKQARVARAIKHNAKMDALKASGEGFYTVRFGTTRVFENEKKAANAVVRVQENLPSNVTVNTLDGWPTQQYAVLASGNVVQGKDALEARLKELSAKDVIHYASEAGVPATTKAAAIKNLLA